MKILIIGGTGFISGYLLRELRKKNYHITLFNRGKSKPFIPVDESVRIVAGDRNNPGDLKALINDEAHYDVIYDMTAYTGQQSQTAVDAFYGKTGHFIHCSTVSVYMISDDLRCPVTEDQDLRQIMPFFPRNPFGMNYGIQKRDCEKILRDHHHPVNFPVTMLRPTYVSGPGDPTLRDYFWIERILDGKPVLIPGSGDYSFQQVYVEDVARAFASLPEQPQTVGEAYNIASEEIFTLNEYLAELGNLMNRKPKIVHVDQDVFDHLPFSSNSRGDVFPFNTRRPAIFSLEKIKRDLKYHSTPFQQWMPELIQWYTNRYSGHSLGYQDRDAEVKFASNWSGDYLKLKKAFIHE
jgi:nucleoside-diphosphate-sugar epimerase